MKFNIQACSVFYIFFLISLPLFMEAQGNHCAVAKSPFRMSMDSGKLVYVNQCLSCHQQDGLGVLETCPSLNSRMVTGDKKKLIATIVNGLDSHNEIDGKSYQHPMPPNPDIKDQEIADVLTYIRNSFGNKASSVKISEVITARSKLK